MVSLVESKFGKSNDVNEVQALNMVDIILTEDKSKLLIFNDFNFVQFSNIFPITVTEAVLKLDKSIDVNEEQL